MKKILLLVAYFALLASAQAGEESAEPSQEWLGDSIQIDVLKDPDSDIFHVRVLAPMYLGDEQFEILSLHSALANEHAMEVGVIVEEVSDLMLEGWVHVVGIKELQKYSLHAYYAVPCADEEKSEECRKEYVFEPVDFVNGK